MKKFLKIFLITLGALILVVVAAAGVASWLVFTPARLTPIVEKQAAKYLGCEVHIDKVDLSLVKIFPEAELQIEGLTLVNPVKGAPCDTLLDVRSATCRADVMALWKKQELLLSHFSLSGGKACVFTDSLGNANYDIFPASPEPEEESTGDGFAIGYMDFRNIALDGVSLSYHDDASRVMAEIAGLSLKVNGTVKGDDIRANVAAAIDGAAFLTDSIGGSVRQMLLEFDGTAGANDIKGNVSAALTGLYTTVSQEEMLSGADIKFATEAAVRQQPLSADISVLMLSVNGMELNASGSAALAEEDAINADISYRFDSWPLDKVAELIPEAYSGYLEGISGLGGSISSAGTVKGVYSKTSMPLLDISVAAEGVKGSYAEIPVPLRSLDADIKVYTDLKDDNISYITINSLRAKTPQSHISLKGRLTDLFSDIHATLQADTDLAMSEFAPFIPDSLGITAAGTAHLTADADLRMSHVEKMELEKIKASGRLALNGFSASYDTLSVATGVTEINFSLPNASPRDAERSFLGADIAADRLEIGMGKSIRALACQPEIAVEMADLRDTTRIQPVWLSAGFESLQASADTVSVSVATPSLRFSMARQRRDEAQPRFSAALNSGSVMAQLGKDSAKADKIDFSANVSYSKSEENFLLRFRPRGKLEAEGICADMATLGSAVEIPVMSLGLTPRELNINDLGIRFAGSDFRLNGTLDNIMPYFRGDSVLKGEFRFISDTTDLNQLLALASGTEGGEQQPEESGFSGPVMVPDNMDITLHTDIKEVLFEDDAIKNVSGDIYIREGNMVLDELTVELPGANAQLTAIYKTPRRNHLFAGIDFHLLDIEIATLLQMIPDLDSMMPMLRSFGGRGEFHFAFETNLDSLYNLKMSTLRGAASIRGEDLVLMDGETFHRIAKKLWFRNKDSEYQIDSLSAEFTIFRNEIDIYPFIVSIDRYAAVVGGRHNLDMTFDYNISLVESPLPFRLAVNVSGNLEKLKFRLTKNKYPGFYRPVSRGEVSNKQRELRNIIRQALVGNIAKKEEE